MSYFSQSMLGFKKQKAVLCEEGVQLAWMIRSLLNAIKTSIVLDPFLLN
jgi:hypothetical protein